LVCGIDPQLYPKLRQARELQQPLNKRIGALQTKLGLNLRGRNIKERLANMPAAQKNTVKLLLVKLKETIGLKEQSEKRIAALEKLAVNQDPVTTKIVIHGRIVPIVRMRILDFTHPVIDELYGREFHVVDGDIGSVPLGSAGS
jgi:hypothetical protein